MKPSRGLRRLPKVLADELHLALTITRPLGDACMDLLAAYRRNRVRAIATWGLLNVGAPVEGLEPIPPEHLKKIEMLDEAFEKLHHYRNGGANDYVASDVAREVAKAQASLPRRRATKADHAEIADFLEKSGYRVSTNQKALILEAKEKFKVSERTVRTALANRGLARK